MTISNLAGVELHPLILDVTGAYRTESFVFSLRDGDNVDSLAQLFHALRNALSSYLCRVVNCHNASRVGGVYWPVLHDAAQSRLWVDPMQTLRDPVALINKTRSLTLVCIPAHRYQYEPAELAMTGVQPPVLDVSVIGVYPLEAFTFSAEKGVDFQSPSQLFHSVREQLSHYYGDKFLLLRYAARVSHAYWQVVHDAQAYRVWFDPLHTVRDPVREINATRKLTLVCANSDPSYFRTRTPRGKSE